MRIYFKQSGVALITVLIFLEILTLLTLYSLHASLWETRITNQYWNKHLLRENAFTTLANIENESSTSCQILPLPAAELKLKSIAWWQSNACAGKIKSYNYYYVIEGLGIDPCARVQADAAVYYRISLLLKSSLHSEERIILQSTFVKPEATDQDCKFKLRSLAAGRQSIREII
jgi:hypothetical protein